MTLTRPLIRIVLSNPEDLLSITDHPVVPVGSQNALELAETIYAAMWNKPLDHLLEEVVVNSTSFKYLSSDHLKQLRLKQMNFNGGVLLVREEYSILLSALEAWWHRRNDAQPPPSGVVVTGQPGIGVSNLNNIFLCTNR
jgi:hypothetical protein